MLEIHQHDKADRRSSMKSHFHGLRGLGHFPNKLKRHFVRTNALLAKIVIPNSLPEPNLLRTSFQEFGITFLSLAVFPMQKCFEYH